MPRCFYSSFFYWWCAGSHEEPLSEAHWHEDDGTPAPTRHPGDLWHRSALPPNFVNFRVLRTWISKVARFMCFVEISTPAPLPSFMLLRTKVVGILKKNRQKTFGRKRTCRQIKIYATECTIFLSFRFVKILSTPNVNKKNSSSIFFFPCWHMQGKAITSNVGPEINTSHGQNVKLAIVISLPLGLYTTVQFAQRIVN